MSSPPPPSSSNQVPPPAPSQGSIVPPEGYMHLRELKDKKIGDLVEMGKEVGIENAGGMRKQDLIFAILQKNAEKDEHIYADGVLECLPDGFGFLRAPDLQLPAGSGRRLRLPVADPPLRPAHRRHRQRLTCARPRRASATSRSSRSSKSTSRPPR